MNLLSIFQAIKNGVDFEFAGQISTNSSCRMMKDGLLLAEASLSCGIYGMQSAYAADVCKCCIDCQGEP